MTHGGKGFITTAMPPSRTFMKTSMGTEALGMDDMKKSLGQVFGSDIQLVRLQK